MSADEVPEDVREQLLPTFRDEAGDLLADMEAALVQLDERPADEELVARSFRALHTLKGNAAVFGLGAMERLAHDLEQLFDLVRKKRMAVTPQLVSLALSAKDCLQELAEPAADPERDPAAAPELRRRLGALLAAGEAGEAGAPEHLLAEAGELLRDLEVALMELERSPDDGELVLRVARALHTIRGDGHRHGLVELESFVAELEAVFLQVRRSGLPAPHELLDTTHEACERMIRLIAGAGSDAGEAALREAELARLHRVVPATPAAANSGAAARPPGPGPAHPEPARREAGSPGGEPAGGAAARERGPAGAEAGTLRVGAGRLDALVDLVGELVTVQARLSRETRHGSREVLAGIAEEVERLTASLRDLTLDIRMVPVRPLFGKFRRHVRDLAHGIGREVEFTTAGEETELDKSVVDRLGDPIVHILRNCIDHGIEAPEERERAGKPRRGRVHLSAAHAGSSVVIRVEDDGRGIDPEAIRRTAVARGLLGEHEACEESALRALIFAPGFSTSERVTRVSGRGVGLDVVRRAVEGLRGEVRVESRRGGGTAFEVRLPLTLAIMEGLAVAVGQERFVLPLAAVHECFEVAGDGRAGRRLSDVACLRGDLLPFIRLRELFDVAQPAPAREQVVVVEQAGRRVGLAVDRVLGGHQTVIKPLGLLYREVRWLAGSTILGDGTVALILEIEQLVRAAEAVGSAGA